MRRRLPVAACLAALLVLPLPGRGAAPAPAARGSAAALSLFAQAEESFSELRRNAQAQRQRQNFTRVLEAYRLVFEKYPATRQSEESLLRAGELQTLLFRWTGQAGDLNQAQNYYERLIQTSPKSPLADDALLAIAYLYLDHFKDPAQAWLRFRDVTQFAPRGDKVAEAKRQLRRLAEYAAPGKVAQAAGPVPETPPAVISAPPPTVVAMPPPTVIAMPVPAIISMPPPSASLLPRPAVSPSTPGNPEATSNVRSIRHWSNPEYSRVVIDLDQRTNFYSNLLEDRSGIGKPPRLYIDLFASLVEERLRKPILVNDGILLGIRAGQFTPDSVRVVLEIDGLRTYRVFPMQDPFRIVVDVTGGDPVIAQGTDGMPAPTVPVAAVPTPGDAVAKPETPPDNSVPRLTEAPPLVSARLSPVPAPPPRYAPEPVPELIPMPAFTPAETRHTPAPVAPAPPTPAAPAATAAPATFSGTTAGAATNTAPARGAGPALSKTRSPATPSPAGKPSLARQLGLGVRRVVIDAGHGAHDPGAIGIGGLQEKDVTLDLALRVRDILQAAGYETVLTRDRDVYLPLEERTALANTARGDLFLSLHCNSSEAGNLSGVETYFLNLASNLRSMQTAARENSMAVANISDLQQIVREIQNSKMDESSQFAARVQRSLNDILHRKYPDIKNLGVKQAPFYVLIGAQMPSVLAEVSFINHRTEGRRLADPAYRQLIAQALVDGVKRYIRTVKTAALAPPGRPTP